jgi:dienelactone hydrolase
VATAAPRQRRAVKTPALGITGGASDVTSEPPAPQPSSFAVGLRVLRFLDTSRTIRLRSGKSLPRALVTYVRYPALGASGETDIPDATPAAGSGPYPLVVFGHGFAVTPQIYARLLESWTRAGYVVAAPVFPGGSADAPGGPDEADVINQPADMSFVISSLLAQNAPGAGPLAGLINPAQVAVAGHSDGAEAALAVAYGRRFHDPRVDAAMIFSGAEMSGTGGYSFPIGGPPLLAVQGTADRSNEPRYTSAYFKLAPRPKFLLRLLGAGHLPPFTREQPQLAIVERASVAFLDRYLKREPSALQRLLAAGAFSGKSVLVGDP